MRREETGPDGEPVLWITAPTPADDAEAEARGFVRSRDVWQVRRPLPAPAPAPIELRSFVPGADDESWLEVNNAAFAWHPEQGNWTLAQFRARQAEPWFEPDDLLVHDVGTRMAGFCWTKVHPDHDPVLGEIYVIAVHPDFHGRGLGEALVLAGLAHLHAKGITVGMLYVDETNTVARRLYDKLGFELDHFDRSYRLGRSPT